MAGTKSQNAKPKRARRKKPASDSIVPLITQMSEKELGEMMKRIDGMRVELRILTFYLLLEQKKFEHERRMATFKQMGSAVAYAPVALVKGAVGVGSSVAGFLKQRFVAVTRRPQESTS